jgi:GT2 family glycosyltransferase
MYPKVIIIVLNWNGIDVSEKCIQSLLQVAYPNSGILLVDNASTDGSFEMLKEKFPDIYFLQNPQNLGFAEGNNRGIKFAFYELAANHVVLLNNDTVVDPAWLQALVDVVDKNPDIGAVGSKIFYLSKPNVIWSEGGSFGGWRGIPTQLRINETDLGILEEPHLVDYASGCSILITRKAFEDVGLLDLDYFLYFEETDWCARARRKGFKIMIAPRSRVWHKVGYSTGAIDAPVHIYYMVRNNFAFLIKNSPCKMIRVLKLAIFTIIIVKRYILRMKTADNRNNNISRLVFRALSDAILGKYGQGPDDLDRLSL